MSKDSNKNYLNLIITALFKKNIFADYELAQIDSKKDK